MSYPGRMVCHGCMADLGGRLDEDSGVWLFECDECVDVDGPLTIEVPDAGSRASGGRSSSGIMAELGLYDGLKEAISRQPGRWLEFGLVEHLYAEIEPDAYRTLVEKYGHVAIEPDNNTASWMLGRALWALQREGELVCKKAGGTGRWSYLSNANAWAVAPPPDDPEVLTWEHFARNRGIDPHTWPSIEWRPTREH